MFFKKIGPHIAKQMSEALQKLTHEKIQVEFNSIQTFESPQVEIDIKEKCFGSYVKFVSPKVSIKGIVMAVFPVSSAKNLTELLLKRYSKETEDARLKLSAFKEGVNILVLTYITEVANALKVKLKMSIPKFLCSHNLEFMKSAPDGLVSVGQFRITREMKEVSSIKGRFVVVF